MNKMLVFAGLAGLVGLWATQGMAQEKTGSATIVVKLPASATLKIAAFVSTQKGATRTFYTPSLEPGWTYSYVLESTWAEGGVNKMVTRTVKFKANKTVEVDLTKAEPAPKSEKVSGQDNTPPPGFTALFNGKDLTGWQGLVEIHKRAKMTKEERAKAQKLADDKYLPHWTVKDGVIEYDGKGNNLQTVKDYGAIELYVDWKIGKKGDSGIYLRGNPQVQIWDNPEGSGGLFNNQKNPRQPLVFADHKPGAWNTFHIIMKGDKVTVKLNGKLVVDNTPLENYWERGKALPATGPIELQHHGDKLWFKNIYVKELPE